MALSGGRAGAGGSRGPASSRVETLQVAMPQLGGRMRTVRVYLPPGYDSTDASFPVLYLQDGQQLFAPGPFGDWLVDETLDRLAGREPDRRVIVVGIDNSEHRWDEYGPWVNEHMRDWITPSWSKPTQGGEGDAYVAFLTETLKPLVDRRYRTRPDRDHTGIGGSSMGALIALHAGLTRPDVFSKVMAMSTAVWFAEAGGPWLSHNRLVQYLAEHPAPANVRFYLDVGSNERSRDTDPDVVDQRGHPLPYPRAYVEGTAVVADALRRAGVPTENLRRVVDQDAVHHESAWAKRLEGAVSWLYQ